MSIDPSDRDAWSLTRRGLLRFGASGLLGFAESSPRSGGEGGAQRCRADACILLFLPGGPSHLDLWDLKPDAPEEVRGPFRPIPTTVPGLGISEHLPRIAGQMHRCTLVRSVHHRVVGVHAAAAYLALTGHDRGERRGGPTPEDYPALGSVLSLRRPPARPALPYVSLPHAVTEEGQIAVPGFLGGLLGRTYDPSFILGNPDGGDLAFPELPLNPDVPSERLGARRGLLRRMEGPVPLGGATEDFLSFRERAYGILGSRGVRRAFRIAEETVATREAYGRTIYGQSVLLARRLIESGTRFVAVNLSPNTNDMTWDHHRDIFYTLGSKRLPVLDACVSSLIADLADRGLLGRTLVAVMGEFGRTPRINREGGRDHWSGCYSVLLAGGGLKAGYAHGSSDRLGAEPSKAAVGPADLIATLYECLGIPAGSAVEGRQGRPFPLVPGGRPILQLLS